jgi:biopolymer transport protein ExbB
MTGLLSPLIGLIDLGGPVVALLSVMSVGALAAVFWKLWQFRIAGVGRHARLDDAIALWDAGRRAQATEALEGARSHLSPLLGAACSAGRSIDDDRRVDAMAEAALDRLERGFRLLDAIAQTAPLLGLFGTVLGMIDAFRALQGAGTVVDPALLAGGIWVALLTTAVGLGVAMPTSLALTWFESRVARERLWLDGALARIRAPRAAQRGQAPAPRRAVAVHAG